MSQFYNFFSFYGTGFARLGVYDDEDGYTEVNIYITDGDHDEDARYQIGALADELTHAAQFEDGEIGYDANRKDNAIAYDFGDEIESREKAVEAAERCACEPASDNALLADPSISREDKLNLLHSRGYRFNSSDGREKVLDVINNPSKSQSLKNSGVNRIIYRENGTTKHKDLK
ncbi:MAG: hypothetical protein H6558_13510 [Lewinellaceae bacterium]|nr:hypothetical protein [Lewinellaceae bacterium]